MNKLMLVEEVAARLRLSEAEVQDLIWRGELPAIIIPPNTVRIAPQHLARFERARTVPLVWPERPSAEAGS